MSIANFIWSEIGIFLVQFGAIEIEVTYIYLSSRYTSSHETFYELLKTKNLLT